MTALQVQDGPGSLFWKSRGRHLFQDYTAALRFQRVPSGMCHT
jgi:hypothetical protein